MDKLDALQVINTIWNDNDASFADKVIEISSAFYSSGLELATTAAFIKATPTELDSLLSLGGLEDEMIYSLSKLDPPKTTWTILANASNKELDEAVKALEEKQAKLEELDYPVSEYIYQRIKKIADPTPEEKVAAIPGYVIKHMLKKGEDFKAVNDWTRKFLNSISYQKKSGKTLTEKQLSYLIKVLNEFADKGVIKRNSIDGDQAQCDMVLDALGR